MLKVFVFVSQSCFLSATILQMLKVIEKELPPSTPCYTELVNRINWSFTCQIVEVAIMV